MNYHLAVRPEVDADLLEAKTWYEKKEPGLGRRFLFEVHRTIGQLGQNPLFYRIRHRRTQIRWTYPPRFPYRIVFRVIRDTVVIYAVLHAARHDRQWKRRI